MKYKLHIAPCSHEAAKYAVMHWHYSRCLPKFKVTKFGVWENGIFIGCVLFSRGATPNIGMPYNLKQTEICELTRVALDKHISPVTKIIKVCVNMLKKLNTNLRLIVSYADIDQSHYGVIYQAGNWIFTGESNKNTRTGFIINGKKTHNKTVYGLGVKQSLESVKKFLDKNATEFISKGKRKYAYPLDKEMRNRIELLKQPYPTCPGSETVSRPALQREVGGATPTSGLKETAVIDA